MNERSCPRRWEVEAERDGRLRGKDLQSALRHRAQCRDCSDEARALSELGAELRALPAAVSDPLTLRRTRQRLLSRWNAELLRGDAPPKSRRTALIFGFAAAAVLAALLWPRLHSREHALGPIQAASLLTIQGGPGARWLEQLSAGTDRVELSDGLASFSVHAHGATRVIIALPDGELEDLGTVFEVEVRDKHTQRVVVREGRVSVRLDGRAHFELEAGQSWTAEPIIAPSASVPMPAPMVTTPAQLTSPARPAKASPVTSTRRPSELPAASSAEDDAYLHIVELLRSGHSTEAKAQAKRYLAQFPGGFRRPEVERLLGH